MAYDTADSDLYEDEPDADTGADDTDLHSDYLAEFDNLTEPLQEERAMGLRDRRFVSIAGAQWEGNWQQQFQNSIMVEVNKTAAGVEKIIADYRANRMIVDFRAVDKDASEDTAETLNGMFRADFYNSKGQQATDCAFEEAVQGGIGAWRLTNKYEDDYDPENDQQRIFFETIADADQCVFWDQNSRLYDKSDAQFCYVVTAMAEEAYNKKWPEFAGNPADWPSTIFKTYYDWYTPDVVRIADRYWYEEVGGLLRIFRNQASGAEQRIWATDLSREQFNQMQTEGWVQNRTRKAKRRQVCKITMNGAGILEPKKIVAGDCIPVIPVYGKRWFIDNMERSRGHVRLALDPQRIYNVQISKLTETAAISPIERPIVTPEQIAGHEKSWAEANINRAPYSLINPQLDPQTGGIATLSPVGIVKPPDLPPVLAALIQITAGDINALTNADDGADEAKANISAEAMDIAATRTDAKSFTYMDNMRQSMQRCGEIYLGMAKAVYVEEGREVQTMDQADQEGTATLAQPYTDPATGKFSIINDLAKGKYKVFSDVTEATSTRRDRTVKTLVNMATISAPSDPELSSICQALALYNMDGEGLGEFQDWIRAKLVSQGVLKPNEEEQKQIEAAKNEPKPPDPAAMLAQATAAKEGALAEKAHADAGKSVADTALSHAKTVQTLAQATHDSALAGKARAETHGAHADAAATLVSPAASSVVPGFDESVPATTAKRIGIFDRMRNLLQGQGG